MQKSSKKWRGLIVALLFLLTMVNGCASTFFRIKNSYQIRNPDYLKSLPAEKIARFYVSEGCVQKTSSFSITIDGGDFYCEGDPRSTILLLPAGTHEIDVEAYFNDDDQGRSGYYYAPSITKSLREDFKGQHTYLLQFEIDRTLGEIKEEINKEKGEGPKKGNGKLDAKTPTREYAYKIVVKDLGTTAAELYRTYIKSDSDLEKNSMIQLFGTITGDTKYCYVFKADRLLFNDVSYQDCISLYTKAIKLDAEDYYIYLRRAVAYQLLEKYDEAIADLNEVIRFEPECAIAYRMLGNIYYIKKDEQNSVKNYNMAASYGDDEAKQLLKAHHRRQWME